MELNHKDVKVYLKILYDNVLDEVSHYKYYLSKFKVNNNCKNTKLNF